MKLALFYHTCLTFNREHGLTIIDDQMAALKAVGLAGVLRQFHVGLNGTEADAVVLQKHLPSQANIFTNSPELWPAGEVATMREMADWSHAHQDYYVLYLHMKGLSFPPGSGAYQQRLDWRIRMEDVVLRRWRECVAHLNSGAESVGQWWHVAFNGQYWAGNEFWVTGKFLSALPYLDIKDQNQGGRYESETWIGRGARLPKIVSL